MKRFLLLAFAVFAVFCAAFSFAAEEEEPSAFKIVQPNEEPHELLPKTCKVCHKNEDVFFFVVAAPDEKGLVVAEDLLLLAHGGSRGKRSKNPHSQITCLFCHVGEPGERESADNMEFRTMGGVVKGVSDLEVTCKLCHLKEMDKHPKVSDRQANADLATAGVVRKKEKPRCTSCHEMHKPEAGPGATTAEYLEFAANSVHVFPHGNKAGCAACHPKDMDPEGEVKFLTEDPNARCSRCHVDVHAKLHPIAVGSSIKTYPMDFNNFPLNKEGLMTCSTCHDEPCKNPLDPKNRNFFRGGPYSATTEFCYKCHPQNGQGALNPHKQVDEGGNVIRSSCVFCHIKPVQSADAKENLGIANTLSYFQSSSELCLGCHDAPPHPSGKNHNIDMAPERVMRLHEYEARHNLKLPIEKDERIVCITCHNPHDKGVLKGKAALGAGEQNLWRVPSFAELCTPCHQRYD